MYGFSNRRAAEVIGVTPSCLRRAKHKGLVPENDGMWSARQVLGFAVRVSARKRGATKEASEEAYYLLSNSELSTLRATCWAGKPYLCLFGYFCGDRLMSWQAVFGPLMQTRATKLQVPYVVVDVNHWISRLDAMMQQEQIKREKKAIKV